MSSKTMSLMGSFFVAGFVVGALQGCGGSSSSDPAAICNQACTKNTTCQGDAAAGLTMSECVSMCTTMVSKSCSNSGAIETAINSCTAMSSCTAFENCIQTNVPKCAGAGGASGTGSGGTSGTGSGGTSGGAGRGGAAGATGAGGASSAQGGAGGAADCSACDNEPGCCVADATAAGASSDVCSLITAAMCNASSGATQSAIIAQCQAITSDGRFNGLAACN